MSSVIVQVLVDSDPFLFGYHVTNFYFCRVDDLKVGTLVGEDARGNKYYEDPKLMLGECSAVSCSCFS